MSQLLARGNASPRALTSLTAVDDRLSLSLDDFPDLTGTLPDQLLSWSEADDLRGIELALDDPSVDDLPGEWQNPSEPLL